MQIFYSKNHKFYYYLVGKRAKNLPDIKFC